MNRWMRSVVAPFSLVVAVASCDGSSTEPTPSPAPPVISGSLSGSEVFFGEEGSFSGEFFASPGVVDSVVVGGRSSLGGVVSGVTAPLADDAEVVARVFASNDGVGVSREYSALVRVLSSVGGVVADVSSAVRFDRPVSYAVSSLDAVVGVFALDSAVVSLGDVRRVYSVLPVSGEFSHGVVDERVSVDVSVFGSLENNGLSKSVVRQGLYAVDVGPVLANVVFAMKTFFDEDVHDGVSLRVRNLVTGEESLYSSEGGRVAFETVAGDLDVTPVAIDDRFFHTLDGLTESFHLAVSDQGCVPVSYARPTWRFSAQEDLVARVYSVDERTDAYAMLARHGDGYDRRIGGERVLSRGVVYIPDPRLDHVAVRIMGGFRTPFESWSWEPDGHSPDPDGLWQRFRAAFEALQTHPAIPDGCRVPQTEFVDADRETYLNEYWDGTVPNDGITPNSLPGVHSFNRRLQSREGRSYVLDEHGNVFLSSSDASTSGGNFSGFPSEHGLMGVREPNLSNPFRCIYGNKVDWDLRDEYIAACYDRDDFFAPLPDVADAHATGFPEDLTRAWLFARVFGQGYYDTYTRDWFPLSREHPVWLRIRGGQPQGISFQEAAGLVTPSAPAGYVREGGLFVPPSASRSVGEKSLAPRSTERLYHVPGIGAPVYFDK